jgi:hypothetical protein
MKSFGSLLIIAFLFLMAFAICAFANENALAGAIIWKCDKRYAISNGHGGMNNFTYAGTALLVTDTCESLPFREDMATISTKNIVVVKNGKLDGKRTVLHDDGKIVWEGDYKDGLLDGYLYFYDENGNITQQILNSQGKPVYKTDF